MFLPTKQQEKKQVLNNIKYQRHNTLITVGMMKTSRMRNRSDRGKCLKYRNRFPIQSVSTHVLTT